MAKAAKPQVVKGSHLTITTYADGKQEFKWDWKKLEKEVAKAIKDYEKANKK